MKYFIKVKSKKEIRYLQELQKGYNIIWLFEEFKENATTFETITEATKKIGELIAEWYWETYIILDLKTYEAVKEISIRDYN
jgi:hypothetical protein